MKSQTMTVSEKMNLLDAALKNLTMTLSQKMELLTKAYENGVLKYEEMTGKLVDEIMRLQRKNLRRSRGRLRRRHRIL